MNNILSVKSLKKIYHTPKEEILAVDNISFSIKEGEFVAIVGPSGCGKSTILSILCGLDEKSDGEIIFSNDCKMGYMLQQDSLFEWRNILSNCLLGLEINGEVSKENVEYVKGLLETYGLKDFMYRYPSSLSGGMRQRVALIRTLATKPDLILLDEPFSALDFQTRLVVSDDVYNIIKKENKSAIIVTHDLSEAISIADKVIVLSKRPSIIKKIINIEFEDRSTPINNRNAREFSHYYDLIWKEIDYNV